jgi:predicted N-acyltransferase
MTRKLRLRLERNLGNVSAEAWNAVANPPGRPYHPFVDWNFLEAAERAGCATQETGWAPHHLLLEDENGALVGAAPFYLKSHSYGEYVFDHAWSDAFRRAGGRYYPKLLSAAPFTPATGPRLLATPGPDQAEIEDTLIAGAVSMAEDNNISVAQWNFLTAEQAERCRRAGALIRHDQQFHFLNEGYKTFDDFLAALSSDKRKNLRKERKRAQEGLEIARLTGADLKEEHWDAFYRFYMDTGSRKWGSPYLNRAFFRLIHERMADKAMLIMAREPGGPWIAGALNFIGGDALYGRYWGRTEDRPFLHFELCYYQAIDAALELGLARVEAGAQGEHKIARGYVPQITISAHYVTDPGFRSALAKYLENERRSVAEHVEILNEYTPFRKE